ncbi:MAG TPA: hypothetical protein VMU18_10790 [Rhodoblastus sp.]|nr:hypothetical protein [Rhodoblastus sp.]
MLSFGLKARAKAPAKAHAPQRATARRRLAGLAAALLALSLLPSSAFAAARLYIQSGGLSRSAVVVQHERLKLRRRPLVIILHPTGGARGHRHLRFEELAESSKPVFLYPEPVGGEWPVAAGAGADRDVKFLRDLIDRFIGEGVADPRKIYLIGESSGGVFAFRAACGGLGRPLAGLATLGAAMPTDLAACLPSPMAFIAIDQLGDARAPVKGGPAKIGTQTYDALPAEATLSIFARSASCAGKREDRPLLERDSHGAPHARGTILSYAGCKPPVEIVQVEAAGAHAGPHKLERPAASASGGGHGFDAARKVWDFLRRNGA